MAIGAGTDVAMESADIILMKNDLRDAVTAMKLSRSVIRNIKENLFWAFSTTASASLWQPVCCIRLLDPAESHVRRGSHEFKQYLRRGKCPAAERL